VPPIRIRVLGGTIPASGVPVNFMQLDSSNIAAAGYDDEGRRLVLRFRSGSAYEYLDVDRHVFEELLTADSAGRFYNQHIKGQFTSNRVQA
jgi:KTSC domain